MAETATSVSTVRPQGGSLARQRMVWAMKPLGLLVLTLWILHPNTADQVSHAHNALLGFLFGALYGLVVCWPILSTYLQIKAPSGRQQPNRVPDEYYWGQVSQVMYDNS